jgi:hypothetical protein
MNQTMSNHLILPLEFLSAFTSRASLYTAVMWLVLRVNEDVRIQEILISVILNLYTREGAKLTWVWKGCTV